MTTDADELVRAAVDEEANTTKPPLDHSAALEALDEAGLQLYHAKVVLIAGMGFFADAYDLFSISLLTKLLGRIYYQDYTPGSKPGVLPIELNAAVTALALVGTLCGQLSFGWLGDRLGRKRVYGLALALMIGSSAGSGLTFGPTSSPAAAIGTLCFFRFFLGLGVGGDYPLSATIISEYSNRRNRGALISAVFAMQGLGILAAAAVTLLVTSIFKSAFPGTPYGHSEELIRGACPPEADFVWRIVLSFGCVPALLTTYLRSKMPESLRYTLQVKGNAAKAARDTERAMSGTASAAAAPLHPPPPPPPAMSTRAFLAAWWRPLLGCSASWFLLDIAFYSQNLFQKDVFVAAGWLPAASSMNALEETWRIARAQALIALGSTVPGYYVSVALMDKLGRIPIQFSGFTIMTALLAVLAGAYDTLREHSTNWFIAIYALTFFFSNFGPNTTTFVLPAELFPTAWKSTAHGFCAASGKAGAIVGAFGFLYASQSRDAAVSRPYPPGIGLRVSLGILAATNFAGMLFTFLIPETKLKSLEELNGEAAEAAEGSEASERG